MVLNRGRRVRWTTSVSAAAGLYVDSAPMNWLFCISLPVDVLRILRDQVGSGYLWTNSVQLNFNP